jgi:hypothetical protein
VLFLDFNSKVQKYLFALVSMGPIQSFAEGLGLWGFHNCHVKILLKISLESLSFALYGKRQAKKNFTVSGNKE